MEKHLNWEWEKFMLEMMCTTKQNIFSKAEEIVQKQIIYKVMSDNQDKFTDRERKVLCASDCILDALYNRIFLGQRMINCTEEKIIEEAHRFAKR